MAAQRLLPPTPKRKLLYNVRRLVGGRLTFWNAMADRAKFMVDCVFAIGDDFGRNYTLKTVPGVILRGEWSLMRMANRKDAYGRPLPVRDMGSMASMPVIPGEEIHVDLSRQEAKIVDPLTRPENESTKETIEKVARQNNILNVDQKMTVQEDRPVGVEKGDGFKTFVRELVRMVEGGSAKLSQGKLPDPDKLEGRYLYDPADTVTQLKPRYEDQVESWKMKVAMAGDS